MPLSEKKSPVDAWQPIMAAPVDPSTLAKKYKILIVDDTPVNLKVIHAYLARDGYRQIETLDDSRKAMDVIFRMDPDLLILDLMMPHVSGLDILQSIRAIPRSRHLPVIVVTAAEERQMKTRSLELGVSDFLAKPVDGEDLILRVRNTLELKAYRDSLEEMVLQRTAELTMSREDIVHCLARAVEYRDNETGNHVIRVGQYVTMMADQLGMDGETCRMMGLASALHDMGKLGIPDAILLKPAALTSEERAQMNEHCEFGAKICTPNRDGQRSVITDHVVMGAMMLSNSSSPLLEMAGRIALTHHERWDGTGYPQGLDAEDIPIEGRITAVADVFDALSNKRPYKPAFPLDDCFAIIEKDAGSHFDPRVVEAFFARRDDVVAVHHAYLDE